MTWTKRDIVLKTYGELSLAGYAFDLDPEELQDALTSLDSMMGEWDGRGIQLGFPIPAGPNDSDLDDDTNLPSYAVRPVYMNLAIAVASSKGKALTQPQAILAKQGYDLLLSKAAMPSPMSYPNTLPLGAGNRRRARTYFPATCSDGIGSGLNGDIELEP